MQIPPSSGSGRSSSGFGALVGVAYSCHAGDGASILQPGYVLVADLLYALIRMMDQPRFRQAV
jgi:hypothetical protein